MLSRRSHFQEPRTACYDDAIAHLRPAATTAWPALGFGPWILLHVSHGEADVIIVLICERCGTARETSPTEFSSAIEAAVHAAAFTPKSRVIEITGLCTNCRREKDGPHTCSRPHASLRLKRQQ